jgi:hypothetical protein
MDDNEALESLKEEKIATNELLQVTNELLAKIIEENEKNNKILVILKGHLAWTFLIILVAVIKYVF